jgi:hypothetical protein
LSKKVVNISVYCPFKYYVVLSKKGINETISRGKLRDADEWRPAGGRSGGSLVYKEIWMAMPHEGRLL